MTKFFNQQSSFTVYKIAENEGGYNYFIKTHVSGQVLVVKENTAGTEYLYANGGHNAATAYTNRSTLTYVNSLDQL